MVPVHSSCCHECLVTNKIMCSIDTPLDAFASHILEICRLRELQALLFCLCDDGMADHMRRILIKRSGDAEYFILRVRPESNNTRNAELAFRKRTGLIEYNVGRFFYCFNLRQIFYENAILHSERRGDGRNGGNGKTDDMCAWTLPIAECGQFTQRRLHRIPEPGPKG